jgi:hypothetical protein
VAVKVIVESSSMPASAIGVTTGAEFTSRTVIVNVPDVVAMPSEAWIVIG